MRLCPHDNGQRLEATLAPGAVLPTIVETMAQALRSPYAAMALKRADDFEIVAAHGQPDRAGNPIELPLRYQTDIIGQLIVAPRAPQDFALVAITQSTGETDAQPETVHRSASGCAGVKTFILDG